MIVRNQLFLKYPWLIPIYSVMGAAFGIWMAGITVLSGPVLIIAGGVVIAVNVWFFYSLKQTRAKQAK